MLGQEEMVKSVTNQAIDVGKSCDYENEDWGTGHSSCYLSQGLSGNICKPKAWVLFKTSLNSRDIYWRMKSIPASFISNILKRGWITYINYLTIRCLELCLWHAHCLPFVCYVKRTYRMHQQRCALDLPWRAFQLYGQTHCTAVHVSCSGNNGLPVGENQNSCTITWGFILTENNRER